MKPLLHAFAIVAYLSAASFAEGTTFHVSPRGSDTNAGSRTAPFKTIQRAADAMQAGDVCVIREGVYRETVKPARSGEPGKPIVFRASRGERVVVSGADEVSGLKPVDGVLRAPVTEPFDQLFVDGQLMNLARWPNATLDVMTPAWAEADAGANANTIVDKELPGLDFTGATLHILPGSKWVSWTRPVKDFEAGTNKLKFEGNWKQNSAHAVQKGTRYFAYGVASLLDAPGEWCWDAASKTVSLIAPDGAKSRTPRVEVKRRLYAFDLSALSHVEVDTINAFAATFNLTGAAYCVVDNCHVRYASSVVQCEGWGTSAHTNSGILLGGHDNILRRSSVVFSAGNGVTLLGENNTVEDCVIRNVDYAAVDCGAIWAEGRGNVISRNTLSDCGRSVIVHRTMKAGRIEFNDIARAGMLTTDLGATYCFGTDGEGTVIAYNWVHDNLAEHVGVGIYIDNNSSNFLIHHNVSWNNPDSGIRLNTPSINNRVYNNTVLQNGNSVSYWGAEGNKEQPGCILANNIFTDEVILGNGIDAHHNYSGKEPGVVGVKLKDFRLGNNSPCIDAGVLVDGVTTDVAGAAPDLGAYERGVRQWRPGHTWGEPPVAGSKPPAGQARMKPWRDSWGHHPPVAKPGPRPSAGRSTHGTVGGNRGRR